MARSVFSVTVLVVILANVQCYPDNCGKPVISPDIPEFEESHGRIIHGTEVELEAIKRVFDIKKFFQGSSS